jgi:hypothetical protein
MMSWSYQSPNPCTVLVKEKPDSNINCASSVQSSTNRPLETQQQDHQQDSTGSLGNNIGGKRRHKRQVLDVVVDDVGHEEVVEAIERRILLNISIGMDKGLGTLKQEVYQLQVAVPIKSNIAKEREFYAYDVHENETNLTKTVEDELTTESVQYSTSDSTESSVSPSVPCECNNDGGLALKYLKKLTATNETNKNDV